MNKIMKITGLICWTFLFIMSIMYAVTGTPIPHISHIGATSVCVLYAIVNFFVD